VADDAIKTSRDQRMPGLDGHQSAEPAAEHKDWPDPQRTSDGEKNDAKPANGIPIDRDRTAVPAPLLTLGVR
jgi:hypothetical protein